MASVFFVCALLQALAVASALFRGRALGWLVPLWFIVSTLATELVLWILLSQLLMLMVGLLLFDATDIAGSLLLLVFGVSGALWVLVRHSDAGITLERALRAGLPADFEAAIPPERSRRLSAQIDSKIWLHPLKFQRPSVEVLRDIAYGEHGKRNLLDIYRPYRAGSHRPVLLHIHGGAWMLGHKAEQAQPLLHHMADIGWVCVSINYRLSPAATFPDHIIDVKRAIAWLRGHIAEYGGDPAFIAVTGGSAGGHLTALAALTPNYPLWQPGFEVSDTRVQAAMPLYGCYDFCNRYGIRRFNSIDAPISQAVIKVAREDNEELWEHGSPVTWVNAEAPPFFVVQGSHDTLIWAEEARNFVAELSAVSEREVVYAELPGAQHAFDVVHSVRTAHWLNAAATWLEWSYADWQARTAGDASSLGTQ